MVAELTGQLVRISIRENGKTFIILDTNPTKPNAGALNLEAIETQAVRKALRETESLKEAADALGINLSTLWRKRKALGL